MTALADSFWPQLSGVLDGRLLPAVLFVFLGGFLRGFSGFGGALAIVPALSLLYGPQNAIPLFMTLELPSIVQLLPTAVRFAERRVIGAMILGMAFGTPVGAWVLVSSHPTVIKIVMSLLVLGMIGLLASGWRLPGATRPSLFLTAGATAGVIQGSAGVGGPPIVALLLSREGASDTIRGNIIAAISSMTLLVLPPLALFGVLTLPLFLGGMLMAPIYLVSIMAGARIYRLRGAAHYRSAALVLLTLIAIGTLFAAVWDLVTTGS